MKKVMLILLLALCALVQSSCAPDGGELYLDAELSRMEAEHSSPDFENKFNEVEEYYVYDCLPKVHFHITPAFGEYTDNYDAALKKWKKADKEAYFSLGTFIQARATDGRRNEDGSYVVAFMFLTDNFTSMDGKNERSAEFMGLDGIERDARLKIHFGDATAPFWVNSGYDIEQKFYEAIVENESGRMAFTYVMFETVYPSGQVYCYE